MNNKLNIRPEIKGIGSLDDKLPKERFQNETLRPIIKLQHDLLVAFFDNYINHSKIKWNELDATQKEKKVTQIFQKDNRFKTEIRGLIIGLFTLEEYQFYQTESSKLNKRIITMIEQRIQSTL